MVTERDPAALPRLCSDLEGCGGAVKETPEDFLVEEIPLYEPSGEGEHLFLTIRKRGLSTLEALRLAARALGLPPGEIGYAGLKDARAVSVQRISVPARLEDRLAALGEVEGLELLAAARHRNKLKKGHLRGNRFTVRIRGVGENAARKAEAVLARLAEEGVPNGFDAQRFGKFLNTHKLGRLITAGDWEGFAREFIAPEGRPGRNDILEALERRDFRRLRETAPALGREERRFLRTIEERGAEAAARSLPKRLRALYLSGFQAFLFNLTLQRRGLADTGEIWEGDLAWLHRNGAVFRVEDAAAEQERVERKEISPSGPLFGGKVLLAGGRQGELEEQTAREYGAGREVFRGIARMPGGRRPYRVPFLEEPRVRETGDGALEIRFALPPGAYATLVLTEVTGG